MKRQVRSSVLVLLFTSVLLGGCASGPQLRTVERIPDKPRPSDQSGVANFESILMQKVSARSIYTRPKEPALMRRLLLSPNLVFDSSRSVPDESVVVSKEPGVTTLREVTGAVGDPVEIELSTPLIKYLSDKGSIVIAPMVTRRGGWDMQCTVASCPKTTWTERLMLMNQKPLAASAGKTGDVALADLPTAALAVRQLGISNRSIDVVVVTNPAKSELLFRPRRASDEPSDCEPLTLTIPVVSFMAEVISAKDGRILARIDEQRTPRLIVDLKPTVAMKKWRQQTATGYTTVDADSGAPRGGSYTYVEGWVPEEQGCRSALKAYKELLEEVYKQMDSKLSGTVADILQLGLDPLY